MNKDFKLFRYFVISNAIISLALTIHIFLYNIELFSPKSFMILIYAFIWFFSLYKIYNFSNLGLKVYISLVLMGFLFNILSNTQVFSKFYYITSLFEHIIIGAILSLAYFSKIQSKFK